MSRAGINILYKIVRDHFPDWDEEEAPDACATHGDPASCEYDEDGNHTGGQA